jgi:hypothetical protein
VGQIRIRTRKVEFDGHTFASAGECARYKELKELQRQGKISCLELQPRFILVKEPEVHSYLCNGKPKKPGRITYVADFKYTEDYEVVIEDFKGMETEVFKLKKKMFLTMYPEYILKLTHKKYNSKTREYGKTYFKEIWRWRRI